MRTLNLGILAHVDAGKTSLTERLLHAAGVIDEIGSVDDGSTQTDSLALERQRGITIKSAVVSFAIDDVTVNLIDTPGHPDFIAEVERVLGVLDGAVLVISAVEGVQAQTRVLMRALQRLRIPTLIFVNKIDRGGARYGRVLRGIAERLTPADRRDGLGPRPGHARAPVHARSARATPRFAARLAEVLPSRDEALLAAYVGDETAVPYCRLRRELAAQARQALVHPVFFGSAITGAGRGCADRRASRSCCPPPRGDADGPVSGAVFKVERGPAGEKIAYVRMFSGTLRVRDRVRFGRDGARKVTAISVFERGPAAPRDVVAAGQIGKLWGLGDIQIGDTIGAPRTAPARHWFAPPTLETVVVPRRPADKGALHLALAQLAEQDPLINLRQDDIRQEIYVSLYGEVQKEVIQATLADDFGIDVDIPRDDHHLHRTAGRDGRRRRDDPPAAQPVHRHGRAAHRAGTAGTGVGFRLAIEPGTLPVPFRKAVEDSARATLRQGLYGWEVTDCTVTLTHSGYVPPQGKRGQAFDANISSTAGDFRSLTPLVLMSALQQAGTRVYEPVHRFHLEIPADTLGLVLPALALLRAVPRAPATQGSLCLLEGEIPAARVHELQQQLPALTRGEGVLEWAFDHYRPVRGPVPARPRTDHNPLNREEYLLRVVRRVAAR